MRRIVLLVGVLGWVALSQADAQSSNGNSNNNNRPGMSGRSNGGGNTGHNHGGSTILPYGPLYWPDGYFYGPPLIMGIPSPYPVYVPEPYPVPVGPPAKPMQPAQPPPNPPPAKAPPPEKPIEPTDDLKPRAEMQRLLRIGNDLFAEGKYSAALKQYEKAIAAAPLEPLAYFHQAQADLAMGKFTSAAVAIQRGLRLHSHWPTSGFQPRALYRDRAGEYQVHLANLAELAQKNPNDDSLLFLLGYQLWFDGKQDEATVLFQRAATLAVDPSLIERFLKPAAPPAEAKPK